MAKLSSILNERFLKKETPKMSSLAKQTTDGELSSFAGIFGLSKLGDTEKEALSLILKKYAQTEETDTSEDLTRLIAITSEVKAINNQAAILHGERIKRAQEILKKYKDGAFTSWLMTTYGNRQTPYNFLQYFEFYSQMPKHLHSQIEAMPRQAVYTLASRQGPLEKKEEIIKGYKGETKQELLTIIRSQFPLDDKDKRKENIPEMCFSTLRRLQNLLLSTEFKTTYQQKKKLTELLQHLQKIINQSEDLPH